MRTGLGAEARIRLDSSPYTIPAYVSFVSPEAQADSIDQMMDWGHTTFVVVIPSGFGSADPDRHR
ncbi:MAG: hypothetical protein ACOH2H_22090 [Cypionkella sp.]